MAPKIFEGVLYPARSCTRFETYNILHSDFYERCTLLAWCAVTICSFTILIITKFRSFIFFFLGFRFKLCCIRLISVIITLSFCSYNTLSHDFVEVISLLFAFWLFECFITGARVYCSFFCWRWVFSPDVTLLVAFAFLCSCLEYLSGAAATSKVCQVSSSPTICSKWGVFFPPGVFFTPHLSLTMTVSLCYV